jgi:hypothetical protein
VPGDYTDGGIESRLREDVRGGAPHRGVRSVAAILPNGRTVWLQVDSPLASSQSLSNLGQLAEHTARWRAAGAQVQGAAIARLSDTIADDTRRSLDAGLARRQALRERVVARNAATDRKLAKAREAHRSRIERQRHIERETVARLRRRDLWDKLVLLSSLPLFAAYGERGRPFGTNNLALFLALLIFLVGDEVVQALFGSEKSSPYPVRDSDVWSYLAPAANLLAGWWLLDDRQHERFVAGTTVIPIDSMHPDPEPSAENPAELLRQYSAEIDLTKAVAPDHVEDFNTFTNVPAVVTIKAIAFSDAGTTAHARVASLVAKVHAGTMTVTLTVATDDTATDPAQAVVSALEVAWILDTQEPEIATP